MKLFSEHVHQNLARVVIAYAGTLWETQKLNIFIIYINMSVIMGGRVRAVFVVQVSSHWAVDDLSQNNDLVTQCGSTVVYTFT